MTVIKINFTYIFGDAGQLKLVWAWTNEVLQQQQSIAKSATFLFLQ
jgi:hypothetical protein